MRHVDLPKSFEMPLISIHTPAKGATPEGGIVVGIAMISIHTPAKGATWGNPYIMRSESISIHTPAKGATISSSALTNSLSYFNPHTREGCDLGIPAAIKDYIVISIHTPAKGAT